MNSYGICLGCLQIRNDFIEPTNEKEYWEMVCGDCNSEAIEMSYESLDKFLDKTPIEKFYEYQKKLIQNRKSYNNSWFKILNLRNDILIKMKEAYDKNEDYVLLINNPPPLKKAWWKFWD
jgi:hypothetical protein